MLGSIASHGICRDVNKRVAFPTVCLRAAVKVVALGAWSSGLLLTSVIHAHPYGALFVAKLQQEN